MSLVVEDRKKRDLNVIPTDLAICLHTADMVLPGEMIVSIDPKEFSHIRLLYGVLLQRRENFWS